MSHGNGTSTFAEPRSPNGREIAPVRGTNTPTAFAATTHYVISHPPQKEPRKRADTTAATYPVQTSTPPTLGLAGSLAGAPPRDALRAREPSFPHPLARRLGRGLLMRSLVPRFRDGKSRFRSPLKFRRKLRLGGGGCFAGWGDADRVVGLRAAE